MSFDPEEEGFQERRSTKSRYSPVITLGNILTIVAMAGSVGSLWVNMNARLSIVETNQLNARDNIARRDAEIAQLRRDWQDSVRELRSDIERQSDKLDRIYELQQSKEQRR